EASTKSFMFRRTPPTCLCSSFRIVVLPRPTPPHKRTIDPTCRPADRLSKALFWAGHSWMPGWFDIKQVECLQAIALRGNLKGKSEEHTSELQSRGHLVCRLLLEKKKLITSVR